MSSTDSPASVKDLPKIGDSLKGELLSPRNLKDVETAEKNVLPTADDVKAEKTHQGLIEGVENFSSEKLKSVKTREPASGKDVAARDLAQQKSVDELAKFDKGQLKHAETAEKNVLPGPDDIKAEQEHNKHVEGIEKFDKGKLSKAETVEKNTLPTKEVIEAEKKA